MSRETASRQRKDVTVTDFGMIEWLGGDEAIGAARRERPAATPGVLREHE